MKRIRPMVATVILALLLVVACATSAYDPAGTQAVNLRMTCSMADTLGFEVVRDLSEIGWCTVRPSFVAAAIGDADGEIGIPEPPSPPEPVVAPADVVAPNADPYLGQQWGLQDVRAPTVWERYTTGSSRVKVAVLDTGQANHPDLPRPAASYNAFDGAATCIDDHGHGTHVAGIIAMVANQIGGRGVAPRVTLLCGKVLDEHGSGTMSTVAAGIIWAAEQDADVINMSLGATSKNGLLDDAVKYATDRGSLIVAAAGNLGTQDAGEKCLYPADYADVVCVGAHDAQEKPTWWSNRWPDVSGPGDGILSTVRGGLYEKWSGTSMASPHVAALAALYISQYGPQEPRALRDRITGAARPILDCEAYYCVAGAADGLLLIERDTLQPTPTRPWDTPPTAYPAPPTATESPSPTPFRSPTVPPTSTAGATATATLTATPDWGATYTALPPHSITVNDIDGTMLFVSLAWLEELEMYHAVYGDGGRTHLNIRCSEAECDALLRLFSRRYVTLGDRMPAGTKMLEWRP